MTVIFVFIIAFSVLMIPSLLIVIFVFIIAFIVASQINIDSIRESISGSLFYENNIISGAIIPTLVIVVIWSS